RIVKATGGDSSAAVMQALEAITKDGKGSGLKSVNDVIAALQENAANTAAAAGAASAVGTGDSKSAVTLSDADRRAIRGALNDPKKGMKLGQISDEQIDRIVKATGGDSSAAVMQALEAITKDGKGSGLKSVNDVIAALQENAANTAAAAGAASAVGTGDSKSAVTLSDADRRAIRGALNDPKKGMKLGQISDEQIDRIVKATGGDSSAAVMQALEAITKDGKGSGLKSVNDVIAALQENAANTAAAAGAASAVGTGDSKSAVTLSDADRRAIRGALNDPKKGMKLGQISDEQIDRIVKATGGDSSAAVMQALEAITKDGKGSGLKSVNDVIAALQENAANTAAAAGAASAVGTGDSKSAVTLSDADRRAIRGALNDPKKGMKLGQISDEQIDRIVKATGGDSSAAVMQALEAITKDRKGSGLKSVNDVIGALQENAANTAAAAGAASAVGTGDSKSAVTLSDADRRAIRGALNDPKKGMKLGQISEEQIDRIVKATGGDSSAAVMQALEAITKDGKGSGLKSVNDVIAALQENAANTAAAADSKSAVTLSDADRRAIRGALNDPKKGMKLGQISDEQIDRIVKATGGDSSAAVMQALEAITKDGKGSGLKSVNDVIAALQE